MSWHRQLPCSARVQTGGRWFAFSSVYTRFPEQAIKTRGFSHSSKRLMQRKLTLEHLDIRHPPSCSCGCYVPRVQFPLVLFCFTERKNEKRSHGRDVTARDSWDDHTKASIRCTKTPLSNTKEYCQRRLQMTSDETPFFETQWKPVVKRILMLYMDGRRPASGGNLMWKDIFYARWQK